MQTARVGDVLEDFHRLGATHVGIACRQSDEIPESVSYAEVNIMTQCFIHFFVLEFKVSSDGVKVVSGIKFQSLNRTDITADIEVLQTRGEVVHIVVKIEKLHGTIKIMVRAEQRGESSSFFMVNKTQSTIHRYREIVTTQVIITGIKVVDLAWRDRGLCTSHKSIQLNTVFLSTHLIVE